MVGSLPACCARAASGHAAAAPPSSVMNSSLQDGAENAMSIRIGSLLPTRNMAGQPQAAPLLELAERAERLGFDSVWASAPAIAYLKAALADFRRPWPSSVSRM